MRLDARNGNPDMSYTVYHAEQCRKLLGVVWADDETHQYGQYAGNHSFLESRITTIQARRITIDTANRFITINPIEDVDGLTDNITTNAKLPKQPCTPA